MEGVLGVPDGLWVAGDGGTTGEAAFGTVTGAVGLKVLTGDPVERLGETPGHLHKAENSACRPCEQSALWQHT